MGRFLHIALSRPVARRAVKTAVLVGAILIAINHGDALFSGQLDAVRWAKMALTVFVPYAVSTSASVAATMELEDASRVA